MAVLNEKHFFERLQRFYLDENGTKDCFHQVDYLTCIVEENGDSKADKQTALMLWLLNVNLLNTITIFGKKTIYFLCSEKQLKYLKLSLKDEILKEIKDVIGVTIRFIEIHGNKDNCLIFFQIIDFMNNNIKFHKIGIFEETNKSNANLQNQWHKCLHKTNWITDYVDDYVGHLMSIKDQEEIVKIKKASTLSSIAYGLSLIPIYDYLDRGENSNTILKHKDIAEKVVDDIINRRNFIMTESCELNFSYEPVVQSGGVYNLTIGSGSDENSLENDIIVLSFGVLWINYKKFNNVSLSRCNCDNYLFLIKVYDNIIKILQDGVRLCEVYDKTIVFVTENNKSSLDHLTDDFGTVIGLELEQESFRISRNSKAICRENMTFNVTVGLKSIFNDKVIKNPPHRYSLLIGDVVQVNKGKPATILHPLCKFKSAGDLVYEKVVLGEIKTD